MYIIPKNLQDEEYSYLRMFLPQQSEDYEVTYNAIEQIKNSSFTGWTVKSREGKKKGYCLFANGHMEISTDCMTSYYGAYGPVLSYLENNLEQQEIKNLLGVYRYVYHTVGNFMPVPEGCNAGTWGRQSDNFSYKLHEIHILFNYFEGIKCDSSQITCANKNAIDQVNNCGGAVPLGGRPRLAYWIKNDWVEKRKKGWKDYVDELYFQDYVKDGGVINFYGNQRFISRRVSDINAIKKSIEDSIILIIKRGYRIKNQSNEKDFDKIDFREIFKTLKESINEVFAFG